MLLITLMLLQTTFTHNMTAVRLQGQAPYEVKGLDTDWAIAGSSLHFSLSVDNLVKKGDLRKISVTRTT
jgi:hypothetical protein